MALKGINAYKKGNLKQQISQADPHKLTLMLMQGTLDKLAYTKGCIERKDYAGKSEHISRALYDYMIQRLIDANVQNSLKIVDEVITLLLPIKSAWSQIPESAKQEAYEMQRQKRQVEI